MEAISRLFPFVWPYRKRVIASILCALCISVLWAGNLSAVLPVVQVLFEKQNLHEHVATQIEQTRQDIARRNTEIPNLQSIEARAKAQSDQSDASKRLVMLTAVDRYVMPIVPRDRFDSIALILALLLVATFFKGMFIYLQEVLVGDVVNRAVVDLRKKCFRHALALDHQKLSSIEPSNLISRMTNDVEILGVGLRTFLVRLIREPLKAGGCIAFAFVLNWRLTLLSITVVPLIGLAFHKFGRSLKKASHGTLESMSGIHKCLAETFGTIKAVIAFGGGRRQRRQFHAANRQYYEKSMKVTHVSAMTRPTTELMGMLAVLAAVLPGTYLVTRQTDSIWGIQLTSGPVMDMAHLSALYALLAGTLDSIRKLSSVYGELKRSTAASDRIFSVLNERTDVPEPVIPRVVTPHSEEIHFRDITFVYPLQGADGKARPPALNNIDLTIKAGEVVAVIGENGSGKSTLINLLPRFMDPSQGAILIDGIDVREMRLKDLRSQMSVVTQETLLFDDTIYENIRYGKTDATWEEVEEAARQAHVIPFVSQLPDGFDTSIGEKGQKLSGGQRQRIALARAIIRDPSILILDEATSAVDSQSEQLIHRALKQFIPGRTVFMITHVINDTFLDLVTRIVVMESGRIAAQGTHAELLATCPTYQRLYQASAPARAA